MSVEAEETWPRQGDNQNNLDKPVWGAAAIGEEINRTERQTHHEVPPSDRGDGRDSGGRGN
jgi:hypothetical protein